MFEWDRFGLNYSYMLEEEYLQRLLRDSKEVIWENYLAWVLKYVSLSAVHTFANFILHVKIK